MNKYIELIDKYLSNEMTDAEKLSFENRLETNSELKKELDTQKQILQGIQSAGIRSEINKGLKKGSFKNKAGKWLMGVVIGALAVTTVMVAKKSSQEKVEIPSIQTTIRKEQRLSVSNQEEILRYELTEENNKNWAEADKQLSSQFFLLNGKRDTVVETKGGIVLAIPAKSFFKSTGELVNDQIELEVKEALNPLDIMRAGLSTTSNGELLRTGGMFYVNARINGENLNIKGKGIYANIPTNERDKDMMLFDGKRTQDGQINWVKPKRFENKLSTVDILGLNFYPNHFLDSLKSFGYAIKNKKLTDSIYYSFVCGEERENGSRVIVPKKDEVKNSLRAGPAVVTPSLCIANSVINGKTQSENSEMPVYTNCEIAPSRIRAVWDKKFNNTLLATKEFEERLQAIFKTCNPEVLNLYLHNLNKKMYEVDSMASGLLNEDKSESNAVFKKFYFRKDGGVSINESHMKELQNYMEEKRSIYEKAALKTMEELYQKEHILDEKAWQERSVHDIKEMDRVNKLFFEEVQTNLESAYGQLGKPYNRPTTFNSVTSFHYESLYWGIPAPCYYSVPIMTTGWKNVDAYTYEATAKRQTLDYVDPTSGKKALIRYTPLTLTIKDSKNYDRIVAYLIPDKLSTFQRIPFKENAYKENLNELIHYSAVVFGFKGDDIYVNCIKEAKVGEQTLDLSLMSRKQVTDYSFLNSGAKTDLIGELNHQLFEHKEVLRKTKLTKRDEVKRRLMPVVFPCAIQQAQPTEAH